MLLNHVSVPLPPLALFPPLPPCPIWMETVLDAVALKFVIAA